MGFLVRLCGPRESADKIKGGSLNSCRSQTVSIDSLTSTMPSFPRPKKESCRPDFTLVQRPAQTLHKNHRRGSNPQPHDISTQINVKIRVVRATDYATAASIGFPGG